MLGNKIELKKLGGGGNNIKSNIYTPEIKVQIKYMVIFKAKLNSGTKLYFLSVTLNLEYIPKIYKRSCWGEG